MSDPRQELSVASDYGFETLPANALPSELVQIEQSRAIAEAQAPFIVAQRFPRNVNQSFANIMTSCQRIHLAEMAFYAYPKGGTMVRGASIRLAEVLAQNWGHIKTGVIEISRSQGFSVAKAYAIDKQTGAEDEKIFTVNHIVDTKKGAKMLTSERDIYELIANMGARRKRACIFAVIPGDIREAAEEQCNKTLKSSKEPLADRIRKMVTLFAEFGIGIPELEKRLKHKMEATIVEEVIDLGAIYKSLKDGMASREQFFDMGENTQAADSVKAILEAKKANGKAAKAETIAAAIETTKAEIADEQQAEKLLEEEQNALPQAFKDIKKQILSANTLDALYIAADLIRECPENLQEQLKELYEHRKKAFSGKQK